MLAKFFPSDDPVLVFQKNAQKLEWLILKTDPDPALAQFVPLEVRLVVPETRHTPFHF
jgi:hypothetical protein